MIKKGDVRQAVAIHIGAFHGSAAQKMSCGRNGIYRISTNSAEESLAVVEFVPHMPGSLLYFQAYDLDDFGTGGSIFLIGGDDDFLQDIIRFWLCSPGISLAIY